MTFATRIRDHARHVALADGTRVYLRRLRETDLQRSREFYAALSPRSRYLRLMQQAPRLPPSTLNALRTQLRDPRCRVLVATVARAGSDEIIAGGRIVPAHRRQTCEFALTVIDSWQGRGVGRVILGALLAAARELGYRRTEGYVLPSNFGMLGLARRSRMHLSAMPDDPQVVRLTRTLLTGVRSYRHRPTRRLPAK